MNKTCKQCQSQFIDKSRNLCAYFCSRKCSNANWYSLNRDHAISKSHLYEENNKELIKIRKNAYAKKRKELDMGFRLASNLRARLSRSVSKNFKKTSLSTYLGCTIHELKAHLESKFQPGMTWDNYGDWHIDHIYPLSKVDYNDENQFNKAVHYTNLQPLWAKDNRIKKDKI